MADDAKTDGNGLIRQVRKILGPTTIGGGTSPLCCTAATAATGSKA